MRKIKLLTTDVNGRALSKEELYATALHEIGHGLGMREHSSNPNDIMFFATTGNVKDRLSDRDMATIKLVYAAVVHADGRIELPVAKAEE